MKKLTGNPLFWAFLMLLAITAGDLVGLSLKTRFVGTAAASPVPSIVADELLAAEGTATQTREVLVLASASTEVCRKASTIAGLTNRRACEIYNKGPNPISCALNVSADAVVDKSRQVDANGGSWAVDLPPWMKVFCRAKTADQVTGAATIATEI